MKDSIQKFVLRTLLAALPVFLFMAFYAIADPFHIVHPTCRDSQGRDSVAVSNNAGFTSVETYLLHNEHYHYDSFIFGSSMSQNFKASYWKPHLDSTASILHFDASSETLTGIINKMRLLNHHGTTIKNALIVIEAKMLERREPSNDDILYVQHPATTSAPDWLHVHSIFFNAFLNLQQVKLALFPDRNKHSGHDNGIVSEIAPNRIGHLNEMYYATVDSIIAVNPDEFYTPERIKSFKRAILPTATQPAIDHEMEVKLLTIKGILDANHSNYIIIVPPRNSFRPLAIQDLWVMKSIFGDNRVHDFSRHPELINNDRVYYDNGAHLISAKCHLLLDSAYRSQQAPALSNPYF